MDFSIYEYVAIFFAFLILALVIALIFRRDFRDDMLGGSGEAIFFKIFTVKGATILVLCGIFIGAILFCLNKIEHTDLTETRNQPITVEINVNFKPNIVNPRHPEFKITAYIKTPKGNRPIKYIDTVKQGALSIKLDVPDMKTPIFLVFETHKGTWQTDDFSVNEMAAMAHKLVIQ
jgi:hypothetical protein